MEPKLLFAKYFPNYKMHCAFKRTDESWLCSAECLAPNGDVLAEAAGRLCATKRETECWAIVKLLAQLDVGIFDRQ